MKKIITILSLTCFLVSPINQVKAVSISPHLTIFVMLPVFGATGKVLNKPKCELALCLEKFAMLGIIYSTLILVDEDTHRIEFTEITKKTADELDITVNERLEFNSSLEEINILKDEIASQLVQEKENHLQIANQLWQDSEEFLSPQAYTALAKVRNAVGKISKN